MRIATRGSELALWQARRVAELLGPGLLGPGLLGGGCEIVVVETSGDRRAEVPVWEMGGQGVFVKEVQAAVLDGRADIAVHSAKDLPSTTAPGLRLCAVPVRADPRDALVGSTLAELRPGATVATGSVRRRAQLAWLRPDLTFTGLRGNIATRLGRVPAGGAVVVAAAALDRLGLLDQAAEILPVDVMLPQVGQGAIAVECRDSDGSTIAAVGAIDDESVSAAVRAERAFLAELGGACDLPAGAHATVANGSIRVEGVLAAADGRHLARTSAAGLVDDGEEIARGIARELIAGRIE